MRPRGVAIRGGKVIYPEVGWRKTCIPLAGSTLLGLRPNPGYPGPTFSFSQCLYKTFYLWLRLNRLKHGLIEGVGNTKDVTEKGSTHLLLGTNKQKEGIRCVNINSFGQNELGYAEQSRTEVGTPEPKQRTLQISWPAFHWIIPARL